jgi:hypothetical protein
MAGNLTAMIASIFSGGVTADPYYEYTTLLLPGNGTNGAQNNTFLDGSTNNFTITRNGNTTQGTFSPFSQTGWSNYFSSANISCPNINFSTNSFCIEGWFYPVELSSANINFWGTDNGASTNPKMIVYISSGNITVDMGNAGTTQFPISVSTSFLSANAWNHIAVVREGLGTNQLKMYINGTMRGSGQLGTNISNITAAFNIGYIGEAFGTKFPGYISNFRIVNGSPVYTADFTPSTTPLTAITNTVLLTCQANRFVDSNTQVAAKTITLTGTPTVVPFSPFNPTASWSAATYGGSGYFDGSGDTISAPNNAAFDFGSGDFTLEFWFYPTAQGQSGYTALLSKFSSSANYAPFSIVQKPSSYDIALSASSTGSSWNLSNGTTSNFGTMIPNAWNHIAVAREGANCRCFLNGSLNQTSNFSTTALMTNSDPVYIASGNFANTYGTGYIASLRMVKGTAVYTAAFTPPTAPLTAITNTSLLLNFTNAGIYDATSKNDLETVGNAQISTTQSKWGGSSMSFDGTGDYLYGPTSRMLVLGSGDFTVEGWFYFNSVASGVLLDWRSDGAGFDFYISSGTLNLSTSGTYYGGTSGITLVTGQWYHIALTRSGTAWRIYVNGASYANITNSTNFTATILRVGYGTGATYFNGYLQDLRLTTGYARYTGASYTVPTSAFPTL